jgi:uncharacterized membrane protein YfcA
MNPAGRQDMEAAGRTRGRWRGWSMPRPALARERPSGPDDARAAARHWRKVASLSLAVFAILLLAFLYRGIRPEDVFSTVNRWYGMVDAEFRWFVLAGFLAQLVDGSLGMGYGVTSASILLSTGAAPAAISAGVHTSELFASAASGYSHYRFGNVNPRLFRALVVPGLLGAAAGAVFLVWLGEGMGAWIRPAVAAYTLLIGVKFILNAFRPDRPRKRFRRHGWLAAFGGFFDSFGGGGWGPIVTSTLVGNGRSHRFVVGTVSLTEFFITLVSALTFFIMIGVSHGKVVIGLMAGSMLAAPVAARLAGRLPRKTAYVLLGILVIVWSARIIWKLL